MKDEDGQTKQAALRAIRRNLTCRKTRK